MKKADLHTHSHYSDGHLSPTELVRLAKRRGIKYLALTDHDSVKGVKEAIKEGKKIGVNIIPALELRIKDGELLSYFININNKKLLKIIKENNRNVQNKIKWQCTKYRKEGYKITYKELEKRFPKAKGNLNELHAFYYLHLKTGENTFDIAKKIKKYKRKSTKVISLLSGIKIIKQAGGVPILAHPWLGNFKKKLKYMDKYVKVGLAGFEINNGDNLKFMRKASKMKNIVPKIRKTAKKYNLILTKGTDFHGPKLAKIMVGKHELGKVYCSENVVKKLKRLI